MIGYLLLFSVFFLCILLLIIISSLKNISDKFEKQTDWISTINRNICISFDTLKSIDKYSKEIKDIIGTSNSLDELKSEVWKHLSEIKCVLHDIDNSFDALKSEVSEINSGTSSIDSSLGDLKDELVDIKEKLPDLSE